MIKVTRCKTMCLTKKFDLIANIVRPNEIKSLRTSFWPFLSFKFCK